MKFNFILINNILFLLILIFSSPSCCFNKPGDDIHIKKADEKVSIYFIGSTGVKEMIKDPYYLICIMVVKYINGKEYSCSFVLRKGNIIGDVSVGFCRDENGKITMEKIDFTTNCKIVDVYFNEEGEEFIKYIDQNGTVFTLKNIKPADR